MESGREQNYWPAFVDALSNVVLTLVFVLVIFVFALAMMSDKVEKKMEEATKAAASNKAAQGNQEKENIELKKQLESMTRELESMHAQAGASAEKKSGAVNQQAVTAQNEDKQIAVENKTTAVNDQGSINVAHASNTVTLSFPLSVAQMDQKSEDQLGHVLAAMEKSTGKHKVIVRSIIGRETYSVAQRMAYYRAVNARSELITKMGEAPSNISISIVTPPQPEDGHVEITFQTK